MAQKEPKRNKYRHRHCTKNFQVLLSSTLELRLGLPKMSWGWLEVFEIPEIKVFLKDFSDCRIFVVKLNFDSFSSACEFISILKFSHQKLVLEVSKMFLYSKIDEF